MDCCVCSRKASKESEESTNKYKWCGKECRKNWIKEYHMKWLRKRKRISNKNLYNDAFGLDDDYEEDAA